MNGYDPFSSYSYGYDSANRQTSVDNANTPNVPHVVLTYAYDVYNNRLHVQDSLGGNLSYGYDAAHNLTQIGLYTNSPAPNLTFGYDTANRLTSISRFISGGDTISSTFSYDNADRLTGITHTDTTKSTTLATFTYGYDTASRLTSYSGPDGSLTYGYDNNNQLTSVSGARSESFSYDANGNRNMAGYTTTHNELTSDGVYNYTYDNEGNLLTQTHISTGTVTNYTWDYRNRLTKVQIGSSTETFTYDVNNNRIGMLVNGTQTWTVFDKSNPLMDFNSSGTLLERYITDPRGLNQFYARVSGSGTTNWYLTDNLNSVRQIIDISGNVLDQLTYSSFGSIVTETNATNGDRFKFTGGAYDSITGTYLDGAREENPADGRWDSPDPLGLSIDTNPYRYVRNNPVDAVDPTGTQVRFLADWIFQGEGRFHPDPSTAGTYPVNPSFNPEIEVLPGLISNGKGTARITIWLASNRFDGIIPPGIYRFSIYLNLFVYNSPPYKGFASASWSIQIPPQTFIVAYTASPTAKNDGSHVSDLQTYFKNYSIRIRQKLRFVLIAVGLLYA